MDINAKVRLTAKTLLKLPNIKYFGLTVFIEKQHNLVSFKRIEKFRRLIWVCLNSKRQKYSS